MLGPSRARGQTQRDAICTQPGAAFVLGERWVGPGGEGGARQRAPWELPGMLCARGLLARWDVGQPGPFLLFHQQRPSSLQGLGSLGWSRVCGTHVFLGNRGPCPSQLAVLEESCPVLGDSLLGRVTPGRGTAGAHSSARIALAVWVMRCGVLFGSDRRQWGWRGHGGR